MLFLERHGMTRDTPSPLLSHHRIADIAGCGSMIDIFWAPIRSIHGTDSLCARA